MLSSGVPLPMIMVQPPLRQTSRCAWIASG
jgi:hypothetical protein